MSLKRRSPVVDAATFDPYSNERDPSLSFEGLAQFPSTEGCLAAPPKAKLTVAADRTDFLKVSKIKSFKAASLIVARSFVVGSRMDMQNPFINKLEHSGFLSEADRTKLLSIVVSRRHVGGGEDLILEGDEPENVIVVLDGFACRYKMMPLGRRHIMALLVSGDCCDLQVALLKHMDHGISTLSPCVIGEIPRSTVEDLTANHLNITRALWWATLTDEATLREWLANMGQRDASRQMAHLFCELLIRLAAVGRAAENSYDFPITQRDLGDVLGLSAVHVNRNLQELRALNLIVLKGKRLTIPDLQQLKAYCSFNPNYLHLPFQMSSSTKIEAS